VQSLRHVMSRAAAESVIAMLRARPLGSAQKPANKARQSVRPKSDGALLRVSKTFVCETPSRTAPPSIPAVPQLTEVVVIGMSQVAVGVTPIDGKVAMPTC
jgi:hypothetical protein